MANAQVASAPLSSVVGLVETPGLTKQIPVPGVMVTLHRVATDSSGPVDSARSDANGRYRITYRRFGDDAVYFAAGVYRGIAYFSAPIRSARATGEEAEITVFDTTSRPVDLHVQGHHLVVSAPHPDGVRDVVEVWELSNDTTVTLVGKDTLAAVWSAAVPHAAAGFTGGQGDVAASSIVRRADRVAVLAPFGPGVKQLSYTYTLPVSAFPLVVPLVSRTNVLEVLVEEQTANVSGALLKATASATTQGRTFKRYLAQDVPAGESIRVTMPTTTASMRERLLIGLAVFIVLAMAAALARSLATRSSPPRRPSSAPMARAEELIASIALLDAQHENGAAAMDDAEYAAARAALKSQLADVLAAAAPPA